MATNSSSAPLPSGACSESRMTETIAVEAILTGFAFIAVVFRFFSRLHVRKGLMADDYAMFFAMLLDLAYFGIAIAAAVDGLDRHISCIPLPTLMSGLRNLFFSQLLLFVAIFAVKLSITLFVLKIGGLSKVFRTALVVNITFLGLANAAFIIELLLQCRPIQGNWNPDVRATANCVSAMGVMVLCYTSAIVSVITDFCCVFLPLPMIWNLQMSRRTKQSIIALLLMGTAAMICGIVRITQVSSPDDMDFTWSLIPIGLSTSAELNLGIITGSLPACRALFLRLLAKHSDRSPPPTEDTLDGHWGGSGRFHILQRLSWVGRIIASRKRATNSLRLSGQPESTTTPWRDARKMESDDGSEKKLQYGGITKIVTIELQREEVDLNRGSDDW